MCLLVRQTASVILLEVLGGLFLLFMLACGFLALRLSAGPIELSTFRQDVEAALATARSGREVSIEALQLEWSPERRRVEVRGRNVTLFDDMARPAAQATSAQISLAGPGFLFGRPEILGIELSDGWISLRQTGPQQWSVAGTPLPSALPQQPPASAQAWIDEAHRLLPQFIATLDTSARDISLERIRFEDFELHIHALSGDRLATVADVSGRYDRDRNSLDLSLAGRGFGPGMPARIETAVTLTSRIQELTGHLDIEGWPLGDLVEQLGFAGPGFEQLNSDMALAFGYAPAAGLQDITFRIITGAGTIAFGDNALPVSNLTLDGTYDQNDDNFLIEASSAAFGPARGAMRITIADALRSEGYRRAELSSGALTVELPGVFAAPFELASLRASGELDFERLAAQGARLAFTHGGGAFVFSGGIARSPGDEGQAGIWTGEIALQTIGAVPVEAVVGLWPLQLADGARRFAAERIEGGRIIGAQGRLVLPEDRSAGDRLRDDDIDIRFSAEDATVRFMQDLPPVTAARGKAQLTGNSFRVDVEEGEFAGWTLEEGHVDFPSFYPAGEPFTVSVRGEGPARELMRAIAESRLDLDFDVNRLSGQGRATFEMSRPTRSDVRPEDVRWRSEGRIVGGGLANAALGFDLTAAAARISADQEALRITGGGKVATSPVEFDWRLPLRNASGRSSLSAETALTPDILNRFGLTGRAVFSGDAPISLRAELDGEKLDTADIRADLTPARLDLSEIGWTKRAGQAAAATVRVGQSGNGTAASITFDGAGAKLDGSFQLGPGGEVVSAILREASIENVADLAGRIQRDTSNHLVVSLSGARLNLSGLLEDPAQLISDGEGDVTPVALSASVDQLILRSGLRLRDAKIEFTSGQEGFERFTAEGLAPGGERISARIEARPAAAPEIRIASGDTGFLAGAILGADYFSGGQLEITGSLETDRTPGRVLIRIDDTRLINAPFLTQILSLASLRGLTDALAGEGVRFSLIEIPLVFRNGRYTIDGGKAQGPALGLTATGFVDTHSSVIEIDGVLVPSFGMNTAFGGIPIIGDLVVGRDGEGVFSLTYSVRGTLERASVAVNPLSALAPGVVRRIFENPGETVIPEAVPRPREAPIPEELPEIKEETF